MPPMFSQNCLKKLGYPKPSLPSEEKRREELKLSAHHMYYGNSY